ncbi:hypothetical protein HHK36_018366 [Tetracentron sinense]|uniref:Uncharacterized protein n=1 Tax=Tetracentron sinense TaxID=13715 RepID=A0A835DB73_TETSI|nr:hypothetical protein HHK36_018366 [Tetracentron sinense]
MEGMASLWSYQEFIQPTHTFYTQQSIDELKQMLLYTNLELESTRMEAKEEIRKNEENVKQLLQFLKKARQERDEARNQLQTLLNKVIPSSPTKICTVPPYFQPESPHVKPTRENSSITDSDGPSETYNPVDSFYDSVSSPDLSNMNMTGTSNIGAPQRPFVHQSNSAISMGIISSAMTKMDHTSLVDNLGKGKPLPQKGRLLQAVIEAGPLLQTLLVAGPLPQWRNPPPLQPFRIPPVSMKGCDPETANHKPVANPNFTVQISHGSPETYSTSMLDFTSGSTSCLNNGQLISAGVDGDLMHHQIPTKKRQRFQ